MVTDSTSQDPKWRIVYEQNGVQGCWTCGAEYAVEGPTGPVCSNCGEQLSEAEVELL